MIRFLKNTASSMLCAWSWLDFEAPSQELDQSIACRRVLLETGVDPTAEYIADNNGFDSAVCDALRNGTVVRSLFWNA